MFFSKRQLDRLKLISTLEGLTVSELVRRAVDDYLAKQAPSTTAGEPDAN